MDLQYSDQSYEKKKLLESLLVGPAMETRMQMKEENGTNLMQEVNEQEYQKVVIGKRSLVEKKSENEMVLEELNLVSDDSSTIYKLIGPVLAK